MKRKLYSLAVAALAAIGVSLGPGTVLAQPVCTWTVTYLCSDDMSGCQCISGSAWENCTPPSPYSCGDCSLSGQFCLN